jgi:hypothetical protein
MIRTPAAAVPPSVAAGPGSDFTLSAFRWAPAGYRIDAAHQRLGFNGELRIGSRTRSRINFAGRGVVVTTVRGSAPSRIQNISMSQASG